MLLLPLLTRNKERRTKNRFRPPNFCHAEERSDEASLLTQPSSGELMRTIRTCSHIKTNGLKCGSPALRHNTLCYFHYQWDRRERRRVRIGGPVGMNKN